MSIAAPALSAGSDPSLASAGSRTAGRILSRVAGQELETVMNGPHLSVLPRDGGPVSAWMLEPAAPLPLLQPRDGLDRTPPALLDLHRAAGLRDLRVRRLSLGGGVVVWGVREA